MFTLFNFQLLLNTVIPAQSFLGACFLFLKTIQIIFSVIYLPNV